MHFPAALLTVLALSTIAAAQVRTAPIPASTALAPAAVTPGAPAQPRPARRDLASTSIQDFVRIDGQSESMLRGIGIVTGLNKTGDSGSELALARPLAELYKNSGNPLGELKDLAKSKSAALVTLQVNIPESGARNGDTFDVSVQISHSASSLKGGVLEISPLLGPLKGMGVFALAAGPIILDDPETPTTGHIRLGCHMLEEIGTSRIGDTFNLIVRPWCRSYGTTRMLANEINGITADLEDGDDADITAVAIDDTVVRVTVPPVERANPTNFVASVLTRRFTPVLIDLPAQVIVNDRTGTIIVTGDVEISAVTVGNDKLTVTTTDPPPVPSVVNPLISRSNWTELGSTASNADRARIEDLLQAFRQLNVPPREQINILDQIHASGRLHARFIRNG